MLRPRIIPCLLIQNGGIVKTVRFGQPKYVGDPINAVRIFNEKEVDEIIVVDIDATVRKQEPNYKMIANLATESRMPLCYGGGVKTATQVRRIISLGVEKVALSAAVVQNPELISEAVSQVGGQSIVVVMDVKNAGNLRPYEVFTHNGTKGAGVDPVTFAIKVEALGAGEIVLNSIDQDGVMKGYDFDLVTRVREAISIPLTALGGAGSLDDIKSLIHTFGIIGAAAGSFFVFKGKYRAVLISYPERYEKENLYQMAVAVN